MAKDEIENALLDPKGMKESTRFKIMFNGIQGILLVALSLVGLNIVWGYNTIADMATVAYWLQFMMLFAEQLWADQIGFNMGLAVMSKKHGQYNNTVLECDGIVEGVLDPQTNKWLVKPLKDDADLVNDATDELNIDRKIEWYKERLFAKIKKIETKRDKVHGRRFFWLWNVWPFRWVKKIRVQARTERINRMNDRIKSLQEGINDKKRHEDLRYRHIKGFEELDANSLLSGSDSQSNKGQPRYNMRNGKKMINKRRSKKLLSKVILSLMGGMIAYQIGASFGESLGQIAYILFMVSMNFVYGWMFAAEYLEAIIVYNESQRRNALVDVRNRVEVKKTSKTAREAQLAKLKADYEKAETEAWAENDRRNALAKELAVKQKAEAEALRVKEDALIREKAKLEADAMMRKAQQEAASKSIPVLKPVQI